MASLPSSRTAPALRRTATAHAACLTLALAAGAAAPLAAHAQVSPAQPPATTATAARSFQVPAGPLGAALTAFAADAGVSISASPALVQGKRTLGLQGRYAVGEGLERLLAGSDLQAQAAGPGSYVLRAVPEASRQGAAGPGGATLAEVRVVAEAERLPRPRPRAWPCRCARRRSRSRCSRASAWTTRASCCRRTWCARPRA
jgi:hypothetical protein